MSIEPIAPRQDHIRVHHGQEVVDPYYWLADAQDERTIALLEAENAYAEAQTEHLEPLREALYQELKGRVVETDMSVPVRSGPWWYYSRIEEGQQHGRYCRIPVSDSDSWDPPTIDPAAPPADEEILLDLDAQAAEHDFFSLGALSVTFDHQRLAWACDTVGNERYTIRVMDLATGELLSSPIEDTGGSIAWSAQGTHLFYTRVDDAWRPHQVWRHEVGATQSDVLVHEEPDEAFFTGLSTSRSHRFIFIASHSKITSEYRILNADNPTGEFAAVAPRRTGVEYHVKHVVKAGKDYLLFIHNSDHPNFSVDLAPLDSPDQRRVLIAGHDDRRVEDVSVFARWMVLSSRRDGLTQLALATIDGDDIGDFLDIDFGSGAYTVGVGGGPEFDPRRIRLSYTSFVEPATILELDPTTGERFILKQAKVNGPFNPDDYRMDRLWATASDGTRIPISLVSRRDTPRDGTAPALLYGYGSYEVCIDPGFSPARLSMLDRGFVYAVAHVRGGGEMGRKWYDEGKLLSKKNTFTDFIACAQHLVAEKYTSPERLVAEGGSAGGLLIGAVANMAPDAFAALVADVPFVDPLTTILDPSLPLTVIEWDEWGNPLADQEVYEYMASYSPYENVRPIEYPAILATTSLNDTRVRFTEPAKWISRLRAESKTTRPLLLKTEMAAGHGGVSGRYEAWRQWAWETAWIIDIVDAPREPLPLS